MTSYEKMKAVMSVHDYREANPGDDIPILSIHWSGSSFPTSGSVP